ncbi:MAG: hypothetical protein R3C29_17860 [Dehalococcoidia bacterium]
MVKPADRKVAAKWLVSKRGISRRRSCGLVNLHRSTLDYESRREDPIELREAMAKEAAERPRFGYRRLWIMVQRRGHVVGLWAFYRHYRELGLALRKWKRKRLKGQARAPQVEAERPNDALVDGLRPRPDRWRQGPFRCSTSSTTAPERLSPSRSRACPSGRVIRVLERIIASARPTGRDHPR